MPDAMGTPAGTAPSRRATRPRNRRGEGAHLRADILSAATGLLDRGDERTVTLRAVARAAGIAAPSIYPHFPNRPAIMLAVVREAFADLSGRLEVAVDDADDAERGLYAACHAYLGFAAAHPVRYRVMFGGLRDPDDGLARLGAEIPRILAGALTGCVTAGRSTSTDPYDDAVALWLSLHGLAHQRAVSLAFPWPASFVRSLVAPLSRTAPPQDSPQPMLTTLAHDGGPAGTYSGSHSV
ncbi:TetR-like C-terminal domain-containing protein [Streptomyces sp. NPDC102441]|uniref:TetR-like C-terminal domain-containing protein n=1 Tax=Streptomyces sp. NPDC102441 TaxID=3366176 RepID=UPI0037F3792D